MANNRLELNQRVTALDLAEALEGQEGTFFCQQGGQAYIAVAAMGHSIASFRAVGRRVIEISSTGGQEPWFIEKISHSQDVLNTGELYGQQHTRSRTDAPSSARQ